MPLTEYTSLVQGKGGGGDEGNGVVGVTHIVALGDASASLCLITTLVFSCGINLMYGFFCTGMLANYVNCLCIVGAPVCSSFVMSYALLEFYYAQMLKKRDDDLCAQEQQGVGDTSAIHVLRVQLRQNADLAVKILNPLRAASRNATWASLMLLQIGGVAQLWDTPYDYLDSDELYESILGFHRPMQAMLASFLVLVSCGAIVNNVQQFRAQFSEATTSSPALPWWPKMSL